MPYLLSNSLYLITVLIGDWIMKRHRKGKKPPVKFEHLAIAHPNSAGIDVGSAEIWVAVAPPFVG